MNGHLNCDVRKGTVHHGVGKGTNRGVVFRVCVVVSDGTDHHGEVLCDLEGKEEGNTPEGGDYSGKGEADITAIK
jgi:hypothetical protein